MKVKNKMKIQQQDENQKRTTTSQKHHWRFFSSKVPSLGLFDF